MNYDNSAKMKFGRQNSGSYGY